MNDRQRDEFAHATTDISEAAFKMVEGQNRLSRQLVIENRELCKRLAETQGENARQQLEILNLHILQDQLDATIVDLITPRSWR